MIQNILNMLFNKGESDKSHLPHNEKVTFLLEVDGLKIGTLKSNEGIWVFHYEDEFIKNGRLSYSRLIGFPDLNKTYRNEVLWPFFRTRIPGLKQPAIQEILKKEKIDENNEAALLKRFGHTTISNPYKLIAI